VIGFATLRLVGRVARINATGLLQLAMTIKPTGS